MVLRVDEEGNATESLLIADNGSNLLQKVQVRFRFDPMQPNLLQQVQPRTGPGPDSRYPMNRKMREVQLATAGGKLHRHFHSSVPDSQYPMHRKMREVKLAAGGRQVAPTFPLIGAHSNLAHSNLAGVGWGE